MNTSASYKYDRARHVLVSSWLTDEMVQLRIGHPSGDSKDEKTPLEVIPYGDESVFVPKSDKPGSVPGKDGANAAVAVPLLSDTGTPPNPQCVVPLEEEQDEEQKPEEADPWNLPELQDNSPSWSELDTRGRVSRVFLGWLGKPVALLTLLYIFICSLDLLSSSFRLLGGKAVGEVFASSALLQNPVAGLMLGILATVTVQSSSTSTSIVITMVAANIIPVNVAIPIIMGANIGTSVTNTLVAMTESGDRNMFRLAFAGATVHDMFNWLAVLVLLPLECATGYLYHLTTALVQAGSFAGDKSAKRDFLKKLTKPLTQRVVTLDKKVIEHIALGHEEYVDKSLIKRCESAEVLVNSTDVNATLSAGNATLAAATNQECPWFILQSIPLSDSWLGLLLLTVSLVLLISCLVLLVKVLKSVLRGRIVQVVKKVVNAEFPGAGYFSMLVGAIMTMLVQSSSIFTSVLTPLVGMGVIRIESMYPLTLGSNIGTTATGLLAAMAASGDKLDAAMQVALVHLFFNISGILLFFPIPQLRVPIRLAKVMGNTTARYRWFAGFYLIMMFLVCPGLVFAVSMAGTIPLGVVVAVVLTTGTAAIVLNVLQDRCPDRLPQKLQTWEFLPFEWMHSLDPLDRAIGKMITFFKRFCCCCCCRRKPEELKIKQVDEEEGDELDDLRVSGPIYIPSGGILPTELCNKLSAEQHWEAESGYWSSREASRFASRVPTPYNSERNSPFASNLPSRTPSVLDMKTARL